VGFDAYKKKPAITSIKADLKQNALSKQNKAPTAYKTQVKKRQLVNKKNATLPKQETVSQLPTLVERKQAKRSRGPPTNKLNGSKQKATYNYNKKKLKSNNIKITK